MIVLHMLLLAAGFAALIKGAGLFVDGSSALAGNFKISKVIIGLTIVAMGTSAPELAVSISAALQGSNEIALSNVVGSNIFNLLGVLGVCAVIHPVPVDKAILKRDIPISIAATVLLLLLSGAGALLQGALPRFGMNDIVGSVSRVTGVVLFLIFSGYTVYLIADARKRAGGEEAGEKVPLWKCAALISSGLALIIGGGQAVVYGARAVARTFGMSETYNRGRGHLPAGAGHICGCRQERRDRACGGKCSRLQHIQHLNDTWHLLRDPSHRGQWGFRL